MRVDIRVVHEISKHSARIFQRTWITRRCCLLGVWNRLRWTSCYISSTQYHAALECNFFSSHLQVIHTFFSFLLFGLHFHTCRLSFHSGFLIGRTYNNVPLFSSICNSPVVRPSRAFAKNIPVLIEGFDLSPFAISFHPTSFSLANNWFYFRHQTCTLLAVSAYRRMEEYI